MGWECSCGNKAQFREINRVKTHVEQDSATRITKILNEYDDQPLVEVRCAACGSAKVRWRDVEQQGTYKYAPGFLVQDHSIQTIVFELTNRCDIDCVFCPRDITDNELDFELVRRLLDENAKLKKPVRHFELGWDMGNPLLHSRFSDILGLLKRQDAEVNVLTNGKNLTKYLKELSIPPKVMFTLFLDHPKPEVNDSLMGKGVYAATLEACQVLKDLGTEFNIYMRLNAKNADQIAPMQKLAKRLGANLTPIEIYPLGRAKDSHLLDDEAKKSAIQQIDKLKLNRSIHFADVAANCTYLRHLRLFIDVDGHLSFCHFLSSNKKSRLHRIGSDSLLELISMNGWHRNIFVREKQAALSRWNQPRKTSAPCSYCLHTLGPNTKW
jgi:MoaA/NifB/PqqE/SkfB family radical SAM enzyme